MKSLSLSLLFALIHHAAGTPSVQECFSDMRNLQYPPIDVEGDICDSIAYNYGPSLSYCLNGDYDFYTSLGFKGIDGQIVTSIFPDGEVVGMGGNAGGSFVEVLHFFMSGSCLFNGMVVDRFIITYKHVDWTNEQYDIGYSFSSAPVLGRLDKNDYCRDSPKPLNSYSLGIKLELGYGNDMRTQPISPHYLFYRSSNPLILTASGDVIPGVEYNISIVAADKCDTDFNHMELHCISDESDKQWSHSLDYSTHQNTHYSSSTIHIEPDQFGRNSQQWTGELYIPFAQTYSIWSSIGFPSAFTCHLLAFDIYGNGKGSVEFYGKGGTPPTEGTKTSSKSGKKGSSTNKSSKSDSLRMLRRFGSY